LTEQSTPVLIAEKLTYSFPARPEFLQSLDLHVSAGECWGIIGPNGAGKSTLLRLLAGLLTPASGTVRLNGRAMHTLPPRTRARELAFLPQQMQCDVPGTGREIALMGRFPHRTLGLFENAADFDIVARALDETEAASFADRPIATLSGGEAQRIHIAAAIAQQPAVFLLDEPTASLDLYHQLSIFAILTQLAQRDGKAVVVVTHDVNLAARFCTHVLLLHDGRCVAAGRPEEVVTPRILESAYDVQLEEIASDGATGRWIVPIRPRAAGNGERGDA
jgi:iron complex transport system ATP-binding protein